MATAMSAAAVSMTPAPGDRLLRFVGDRVRFSATAAGAPKEWRILLRTNLGRVASARSEIVGHFGAETFADASWRDVAMRRDGDDWTIDLPLCEVGFFRAKAYAVDKDGVQHWPDGRDVELTVHPNAYRTDNTIYCAFVRLFGATRAAATTRDDKREAQLNDLDKAGYAVIPPSGKFRDLIKQLPHIVDRLGCRIIHLLPINPTPTTYARFGRFGSPYAVQDLTAVDPALVEFDRRTTGIDQFRELTYAAHAKGARVFIDMVINHTGWGSALQERHPDWFRRNADGSFASPGAWGTTWEDLVELEHGATAVWQTLADAFLTWCRRGVDGFRCDAGYMVPLPVWQYITARVRQEYPDTIFLLEGLGGALEVTDRLLSEGGMQWAYSELFQNFSPIDLASYLDRCYAESARTGVLVHYSETHDNHRLAAKGLEWSLMRNRLSAMTSANGAFGFTCGVEWLAAEKIDVHGCAGLNWDHEPNIIDELSHLNHLLAEHPCFFDGARVARVSQPESPVYALRRDSADDQDHVLILINTDAKNRQNFVIGDELYRSLGEPKFDLLGKSDQMLTRRAEGLLTCMLPPGGCCCLSPQAQPIGLSGADYRRRRAQAAWAYRALHRILPIEDIGPCDWRELAAMVHDDPSRFLAALSHIDAADARRDPVSALRVAMAVDDWAHVVAWSANDLNRITPIPPKHWLLVRGDTPFTCNLRFDDGTRTVSHHAIHVKAGYVAFFRPLEEEAGATLIIDHLESSTRQARAALRFLGPTPRQEIGDVADGTALLTNGRGGMARLRVDLGSIVSKYDCLLGANLHPRVPSDRHILAKRARCWVNADGFITPLDRRNLVSFHPGPPARWRFRANAGDGRIVTIDLAADMLDGRNTTVLRFSRPKLPPDERELPERCRVHVVARVDIEDRSFHHETRRTPDSERHFAANTGALKNGFVFTPAPDRTLRVTADAGRYHHAGEWSMHIEHPIEASRGLASIGDAFSPGWHELPLERGDSAFLTVCADPEEPPRALVRDFEKARDESARAITSACAPDDWFGRQLKLSASAFVVARDAGKTVIAGYPWFLDWGRDSLIACRGLIAAGMVEDVQRLLLVFAAFEQGGTLPNFINGEDATNRDTSDAPLWFALACAEAAEKSGILLYSSKAGKRTLADVLASIAEGYRNGANNGIRMDAESGLIWSPPHFTWMDTNYPAATPRAGYPIEIQALWIRLLRQVADLTGRKDWSKLADRATRSFNDLFWLEERGYFADLLVAPAQVGARAAVTDTALRCNGLFAVSLGLADGPRAQRCVAAAMRHLVVPGALRTLAPLPVTPHLPVYSAAGQLLNNPAEPYWGRYEGDEDRRRKLAYHNGTAWTWTFPTFCEALARAWNFSPAAVATARAYLGSMDCLLNTNCIGHLPEIVDGDAPHQQRGCDAQAWGATEALRVWNLLRSQ